MSKIMNAEVKYIPVNGIELEVYEAGEANRGNPIVLCHGWPELAFTWRHQIPALVEAGFHVIVPNQRGFGHSSKPDHVTDYDIINLTRDLIELLDYYEYDASIFIGHDWGANVVWSLAQLHPNRVSKIINMSLPYQELGQMPWIELMEMLFGPDNYFVHFNRKPGVADKVFDANVERFLNNLYRKNIPMGEPRPGMELINLAFDERPLGEAIMSEADLHVYVSSFLDSGFSGGINWYRNMDRNWHIMKDVDPMIHQSTLMIYGDQDVIPKSETLGNYVSNLDVVSLGCGHWIQEEMPDEVNRVILEWLGR